MITSIPFYAQATVYSLLTIVNAIIMIHNVATLAQPSTGNSRREIPIFLKSELEMTTNNLHKLVASNLCFSFTTMTLIVAISNNDFLKTICNILKILIVFTVVCLTRLIVMRRIRWVQGYVGSRGSDLVVVFCYSMLAILFLSKFNDSQVYMASCIVSIIISIVCLFILHTMDRAMKYRSVSKEQGLENLSIDGSSEDLAISSSFSGLQIQEGIVMIDEKKGRHSREKAVDFSLPRQENPDEVNNSIHYSISLLRVTCFALSILDLAVITSSIFSNEALAICLVIYQLSIQWSTTLEKRRIEGKIVRSLLRDLEGRGRGVTEIVSPRSKAVNRMSPKESPRIELATPSRKESNSEGKTERVINIRPHFNDDFIQVDT